MADRILGIETSCDETGVGLVRGQTQKFRVLDNDTRGEPKGQGGGGAKAAGSGVIAAISPAKPTLGGGGAGAATAFRRDVAPYLAHVRTGGGYYSLVSARKP